MQQDNNLIPVEVKPTLLEQQHNWPLIARDIVMMIQPTEGTVYTASQIADHYKIEHEDFEMLLRLPIFVDIVKAEMARMKELGPFAGHRFRAEAIASDLQEKLYARAMNDDMEDKNTLKLLDILLRSAGLDAPAEKKKNDTNVQQTAVNIAFNIPKLPTNKKLAHIMEQPHTNVIDLPSI